MDPVQLLRQALEKGDLDSDEFFELALFLMQDNEFKNNEEEVLSGLSKEGFTEQVESARSALNDAREMVESGVVNDWQPTPEGPPPGGQNVGQFHDIATAVASFIPAFKGARFGVQGIKWILNQMRAHPIAVGLPATAAAGIGVDSFLSQGPAFDEDPGTGGDHNAASPDPTQVPQGDSPVGYVVDQDGSMTGTPGAVVPIPQDQLPGEFSTNTDPAAIGNEPSFGPGLSGSQFVAQGLSGLNTGPQAQFLEPRSLGQTQINDPMTLPQVDPIGQTTPPAALSRGVSPTGRPLPDHLSGPQRSGVPRGTNIFEQTFGVSPDAALSRRESTAENVLGQMDVPAGAQLEGRAFAEFQGRPLLDWARVAAAQHGVPLNILYGMVSLESGWDPNAVGDQGTSFGLVQIHRPAFPNISRTQALNPRFALNFAAQQLKERHGKYGSWEAAVAAHNSPVAADYFAKTGNFYNDKSQSYTSAVLERANNSGLSSHIFDFGGPGGTAPSVAGVGTSMGGESAVFPVEGAQMPTASQIGHERDGGARQHQGLDIMAPEGSNVYSTVEGTVRYASNRGGKGGYAVSIEDSHGNWHYFAHLAPSSASVWQSNAIREGAQVAAGTVIGHVGSTGNASGGSPHLHYSINEGRKNAPLIDPFDWLSGANMAPSPEFEAFQAPDPAVSRDFVSNLYADLLGRDPTERELEAGRGRLTALQRQQYQGGIEAARGFETTQIDPAARFQEEIQESGEFAFQEDRTDLRSFSDYAAEVASLLQTGL